MNSWGWPNRQTAKPEASLRRPAHQSGRPAQFGVDRRCLVIPFSLPKTLHPEPRVLHPASCILLENWELLQHQHQRQPKHISRVLKMSHSPSAQRTYPSRGVPTTLRPIYKNYPKFKKILNRERFKSLLGNINLRVPRLLI